MLKIGGNLKARGSTSRKKWVGKQNLKEGQPASEPNIVL